MAYGAYKVVARAQGVKPVTLDYIVSDLNVTISPASAETVRMRVIDTRTGRPVPGAKIAIGGEDNNSTEDADSETAVDDEENDAAIDGEEDIAVADTAEYDILDRPGTYLAGAVRAVCEYNPAFMGRNSQALSVSVDK